VAGVARRLAVAVDLFRSGKKVEDVFVVYGSSWGPETGTNARTEGRAGEANITMWRRPSEGRCGCAAEHHPGSRPRPPWPAAVRHRKTLHGQARWTGPPSGTGLAGGAGAEVGGGNGMHPAGSAPERAALVMLRTSGAGPGAGLAGSDDAQEPSLRDCRSRPRSQLDRAYGGPVRPGSGQTRRPG